MLLICVHHVAFDGTSVTVFLSEFTSLYSGDVSSLPAVPFKYIDYAIRERDFSTSDALIPSMDWWGNIY